MSLVASLVRQEQLAIPSLMVHKFFTYFVARIPSLSTTLLWETVESLAVCKVTAIHCFPSATEPFISS